MPSCAVPVCSVTDRWGASLYSIPADGHKNKARAEQWREFLRRNGGNPDNGRSFRICQYHFRESDLVEPTAGAAVQRTRLKNTAVPSINGPARLQRPQRPQLEPARRIGYLDTSALQVPGEPDNLPGSTRDAERDSDDNLGDRDFHQLDDAELRIGAFSVTLAPSAIPDQSKRCQRPISRVQDDSSPKPDEEILEHPLLQLREHHAGRRSHSGDSSIISDAEPMMDQLAEEEPSHLERLKSEGFALVHVSCLDELTEVCLHCSDGGLCGQPITKKDKRTEGTALVWSLECASGHFRTWESQPRIQGGQQFLGNFLLAAAAVIAGLAQETVKRFFSLFGILSVGLAAFFKENESAIHHAVMDLYGIHEKEVSEKLKSIGQPVFLAGHSRYTGSGNRKSTSCCYSLQDLQSGLVTSFTVSNQKEDKCTTASDLETTARQTAFEKMKPVVEVLAFCPEQSLITHTLGRSFSSERFSPADHPDLWRLVRKLNARLIRLSRQKGMDQVKLWIGYTLNHLLYSAQTSNGSPGELVRKWTELAHHVADEHQWLGEDGKGQKCSHAGLAGTHAQIPWLIQGSVVHEALCSLVLNEKLLEVMKGLSLVSHEARYDKFQSVVANYVPEVGLSEKAGLETRMALAVVEHNVCSMNELDGFLKKSSQTAKRGDEWRHELIRKCLQLSSNCLMIFANEFLLFVS